jgi:hypothetical protein
LLDCLSTVIYTVCVSSESYLHMLHFHQIDCGNLFAFQNVIFSSFFCTFFGFYLSYFFLLLLLFLFFFLWFYSKINSHLPCKYYYMMCNLSATDDESFGHPSRCVCRRNTVFQSSWRSYYQIHRSRQDNGDNIHPFLAEVDCRMLTADTPFSNSQIHHTE